MTLVDCPECSQSISDAAQSCPSCGYPLNHPQGNSGRKVVLVIALVLGLFGAIVGFTVGNPAFGAAGAVAVAVSGIKLALMA